MKVSMYSWNVNMTGQVLEKCLYGLYATHFSMSIVCRTVNCNIWLYSGDWFLHHINTIIHTVLFTYSLVTTNWLELTLSSQLIRIWQIIKFTRIIKRCPFSYSNMIYCKSFLVFSEQCFKITPTLRGVVCEWFFLDHVLPHRLYIHSLWFFFHTVYIHTFWSTLVNLFWF